MVRVFLRELIEVCVGFPGLLFGEFRHGHAANEAVQVDGRFPLEVGQRFLGLHAFPQRGQQGVEILVGKRFALVSVHGSEPEFLRRDGQHQAGRCFHIGDWDGRRAGRGAHAAIAKPTPKASIATTIDPRRCIDCLLCWNAATRDEARSGVFGSVGAPPRRPGDDYGSLPPKLPTRQAPSRNRRRRCGGENQCARSPRRSSRRRRGIPRRGHSALRP